MSDDLGNKVQQILQMLGQENAPDNLKELVTLLANSLGKKETEVQQTVPSETDILEKTANTDSAINPDMLNNTRKAIDRLSKGSDPRINLLHAIKPFMNSKRQEKIGNCIQLLQVAGLSRILNDQEK